MAKEAVDGALDEINEANGDVTICRHRTGSSRALLEILQAPQQQATP